MYCITQFLNNPSRQILICFTVTNNILCSYSYRFFSFGLVYISRRFKRTGKALQNGAYRRRTGRGRLEPGMGPSNHSMIEVVMIYSVAIDARYELEHFPRAIVRPRRVFSIITTLRCGGGTERPFHTADVYSTGSWD